jgi:hypothetical protein
MKAVTANGTALLHLRVPYTLITYDQLIYKASVGNSGTGSDISGNTPALKTCCETAKLLHYVGKGRNLISSPSSAAISYQIASEILC